MSNFEKIDIKTLNDNFFTKIGEEWMLVTAGNETAFNTMTASWGGVGILWNRNVTFTFIRESRYTLEFLNSNDYYTLSFFGGKYTKELAYCGTNSGRDVDKVKETGLTPVFDGNVTYFEEAELVLVCKKLYQQKMNAESFIEKELISNCYPDANYHYTFAGEIVSVLKKK